MLMVVDAAVMAAGYDPCRRLIILFPGGSYFNLHALHFIFLILFSPIFLFIFPVFSQRKFSFFTAAAI